MTLQELLTVIEKEEKYEIACCEVITVDDEDEFELDECLEATKANEQSTQDPVMEDDEDDFDIDEYLEDSISDLSSYDEEASDDECDLERQIGAYLEESNEEARLRTLAKLALDDRQQQLNVEKVTKKAEETEPKIMATFLIFQLKVAKRATYQVDLLFHN